MSGSLPSADAMWVIGDEDCGHDWEAVRWNPYNAVIQCHVCGRVFDHVGVPGTEQQT